MVVATHAGTGLKISGGKIEANGLGHSFGGTMLITDGNFLVSIGKFLTAAGLERKYFQNNDTNLTADGQIHVYTWRSNAWVSLMTLGNSSLGGTTEVASIVHPGANEYGLFVHGTSASTGSVGVDVIEDGSGSIGVRSQGETAADLDGMGNNAALVVGQVYGIRSGPRPLAGANFKSPLVLTPSSSASAPTHSADAGSFWVTSAGVLYINTNGSTTWQKVGAQ